MEEQQIKQIIGQIEASINKFEKTDVEEPEYREYCDAAYTCISYWKNELRKVKSDD